MNVQLLQQRHTASSGADQRRAELALAEHADDDDVMAEEQGGAQTAGVNERKTESEQPADITTAQKTADDVSKEANHSTEVGEGSTVSDDVKKEANRATAGGGGSTVSDDVKKEATHITAGGEGSTVSDDVKKEAIRATAGGEGSTVSDDVKKTADNDGTKDVTCTNAVTSQDDTKLTEGDTHKSTDSAPNDQAVGSHAHNATSAPVTIDANKNNSETFVPATADIIHANTAAPDSSNSNNQITHSSNEKDDCKNSADAGGTPSYQEVSHAELRRQQTMMERKM